MNQIDPKKLEIKYLIGFYSLDSDYESCIDLLFELASNDEIINQKPFDFETARFLLTKKITKQNFNKLINELIEQNFVQCIENKKYILLNHKW